MKKMIIYVIVLVFLPWGCNRDTMIDPVISGNTIMQQPDTAKTVQKLPDSVQMGQQVPDTTNQGTISVLSEFKDIDNNVYHAIKIGRQIWSKENLKTTHYNDGTPIPLAQDKSGWYAMNSGAYCHYNSDISISITYGLLYNYYAVASGKLAPKGWHVATNEDWEKLWTEVGIINQNGDVDVGPLVDAKDWKEPFYALTRNYEERLIVCTNSSGFTALPNGYRDNALSHDYPEFDCLGGQASWWTSNKVIIYMDGTFGVFPRDDRPRQTGSGIRLVKND
jgi:uncharacterized protein (TIGR02145 family)